MWITSNGTTYHRVSDVTKVVVSKDRLSLILSMERKDGGPWELTVLNITENKHKLNITIK